MRTARTLQADTICISLTLRAPQLMVYSFSQHSLQHTHLDPVLLLTTMQHKGSADPRCNGNLPPLKELKLLLMRDSMLPDIEQFYWPDYRSSSFFKSLRVLCRVSICTPVLPLTKCNANAACNAEPI